MSVLRQLLLAAMAEIERQRLQIAALQRNRFGRRSEQLDEETLRYIEDGIKMLNRPEVPKNPWER